MESVSLEENKALLDIKAVCINSLAPMRSETSDASEMVSELLFGELCTIIEKKNGWRKIKALFDDYEGWVDYKQISELSDAQYKELQNSVDYCSHSHELLEQNQQPFPISLGAEFRNVKNNTLQYGSFEFLDIPEMPKYEINKSQLVDLALRYINVPYIWGGKSTMGVDCSGLVQTVYKIIGVPLPRDAYQQAEIGTVLSFIEESEAGDLAFFDNEEGRIIHVGIIMENRQILHAHGKVRIDTLDHSGIYNTELQKHTHKLRFIRKII